MTDSRLQKLAMPTLISLILLAVTLSLLNCLRNSPSQTDFWLAALVLFPALTLAVFLILIYMGYLADRSLSKGEMRRAIAGTFVVGLQMLLFFSLVFKVYEEKVLTTYLTAMTTILGFYFGSRTAQQTQSEPSRIAIENVFFGEKEIVVSVRNLTPQNVSVDVVYVGDYPVKLKEVIRIPPGEVEFVHVPFEWEKGKVYGIRVHSKEGYKAEVRKKATGGESDEA